MMMQPQRREATDERAPTIESAPAPVAWAVARRAPPTLQAHIIETMNERLASAVELSAAVKLVHRQLADHRDLRSESLVRELHAVLDSYVEALVTRITQLGGVRAPVRAALRAPGHATPRVRATDGPARPEALLRTLGELGAHPPEERLVQGALGAPDRAATCTVVAQAVYHWLWCLEATHEPPAPAPSPRAPAARRP
jgi:hypothetical protein